MTNNRSSAISNRRNHIRTAMKGKNTPNDKSLWSRAISEAKKRFRVYPSAYANGWAAQWYKKHGGTWKREKAVSESSPTVNDWTKEKWYDVTKPLENGGFSLCKNQIGDKTMVEYQRDNPTCFPSSVISNMSKEQIIQSIKLYITSGKK